MTEKEPREPHRQTNQLFGIILITVLLVVVVIGIVVRYKVTHKEIAYELGNTIK